MQKLNFIFYYPLIYFHSQTIHSSHIPPLPTVPYCVISCVNNIDICGPSTYYKISTDVSHLDALENKKQLSDLLANFHIYQIFGPKISAELTEVETFRNKFHFYFSPKAKRFF